MKKLLFLILSILLILSKPARAGTNATLVFRTNDYQVPIANWWQSNATAIVNGLNAAGYTLSGGGGGNAFNPAQINTNGSAQVQIYSLSTGALVGTISTANLNTALAALSSSDAAALTNYVITNLIGTISPTNLNAALATISSNNGVNITNFNTVAISNALPTTVLTNSGAFLPNNNPLLTGNLQIGTQNAGVYFTNSGALIQEAGNALQFTAGGGGAFLLDASGNLLPTGGVKLSGTNAFQGKLNATNLTGGPFPISVLPSQVLTNNNPPTNPYSSYLSNSTYSGANQFTGDLAFPWVLQATLANGPNADLPTATNTAIDIGGPTAAFSLDGLAGGRDGRVIWIENNTGFPMTLANNSGLDTTPANRILTGTAADLTVNNTPALVQLVYRGLLNRWMVQSLNNAGVGIPQVNGVASNLTLTGATTVGTIAGPFGPLTNGYVVPSGSTFAALTNILQLGGNITLQPGDYYNMSNIVPVNGTTITGYGATLHFAPGCANFMFDEGTNVQNVVLVGLRFTGDAFANYASSGMMQPYTSGQNTHYLFNPWYSGQIANTYTNRSGLRMNFSGNCQAFGCKFDGFGGFGVMAVGTNDLTQSGGNNTGLFMGNTCCSNWINFFTPAWAYNYLQPGQSAQPWSQNNVCAEYGVVVGNHFDTGGIGFYNGCGNLTFGENEVTGNYIQMVVEGNQNPGHGTTTGNTFNHGTYGLIVLNSQINITGNQFLSDSTFVWDSVSKANFSENRFDAGSTFIVTNSGGNAMGTVRIVNNTYEGAWSTITLQTNLGPAPNGGFVVISGNISADTAGDTDGSVLSAFETMTPTTLLNTNIVVSGTNYTFTGGILTAHSP